MSSTTMQLPLPSTGPVVEASTSSALRLNQRVTDIPTPSGTSFTPFHGLRRSFSLSSAPGKGQVIVFRKTSLKLALQRHTAVVAVAVAGDSIPALEDLPLIPYINQNGRIVPPVETNTTKASVFAICDANKKVQYIGFSKDVRNSLRTLMGRRPEFCYFYKIYNLDSLDQQKMLSCRQKWVAELGLAPVGNGDPVQKNLWEQPGDAGSISARGKVAAANAKAKTLIQLMVDRGLKEEMVYDPALLEQGKCDVLTTLKQTAAEIAESEKILAEEAARRRAVVVESPTGEKVEFEIFFEMKFPTNGGWMYDILVSKDEKETRHRVICGRIYPESVNLSEDRFVEIIMGFLLHKKVPRRTEGLMSMDDFPINYFAVSEVAQDFEDLKDWFKDLGELPDTYWRFNKIHSYGASSDPAPTLGTGPSFDHSGSRSVVSGQPL